MSFTPTQQRSHLITSSVEVVGLFWGLVAAMLWCVGFLLAYFCLLISGSRSEVGLIADVAMYSGAAYVFVGWAFYPVGGLLLLLSWMFHLLTLKSTVFHLASRVFNVLASILFVIPFGILALELSIVLFIMQWYG